MTEPTVDRAAWVATVTAARDGGATFFDVLTAVDVGDDGFEVVVHLWDPAARSGALLRTTCPRADAVVPSLLGVFGGAGWHERAAAELFGITFTGHDTAPLLLAEGFEGHPLRKDFVLASRAARRWPGLKEPGESDADLAPQDAPPARRPRRRLTPPGTDPTWGSP